MRNCCWLKCGEKTTASYPTGASSASKRSQRSRYVSAKPFDGSARTGKIVIGVCPSEQSSSVSRIELRREKHRLALEHLHRKKQRDSRVHARAAENQSNVFPVIGSGDQLLTEQADV